MQYNFNPNNGILLMESGGIKENEIYLYFRKGAGKAKRILPTTYSNSSANVISLCNHTMNYLEEWTMEEIDHFPQNKDRKEIIGNEKNKEVLNIASQKIYKATNPYKKIEFNTADFKNITPAMVEELAYARMYNFRSPKRSVIYEQRFVYCPRVAINGDSYTHWVQDSQDIDQAICISCFFGQVQNTEGFRASIKRDPTKCWVICRYEYVVGEGNFLRMTFHNPKMYCSNCKLTPLFIFRPLFKRGPGGVRSWDTNTEILEARRIDKMITDIQLIGSLSDVAGVSATNLTRWFESH